MNFSVILEPQKVEYSSLMEDASSPLWKLNVRNLKMLIIYELVELYHKPFVSKEFQRMIVYTLSTHRRNVDGKKI